MHRQIDIWDVAAGAVEIGIALSVIALLAITYYWPGWEASGDL